MLVEPWGGAALGMRVDHRNRLFVAGGGTGTASVYDARSGELLQRYTLTAAPTFVNDVIVTHRAAYVTDSQKRQLYVLDLGRRGKLPTAAQGPHAVRGPEPAQPDRRGAARPRSRQGKDHRLLTDSDLDVPTTIARKGGFLWAVNARFTTPPTPDTEYDVVRVGNHGRR